LKNSLKFELSKIASLVQLVERRSPKPNVEGSSPSRRDSKKKFIEKKIKLMYNKIGNILDLFVLFI
jgi:hypothetical protein